VIPVDAVVEVSTEVVVGRVFFKSRSMFMEVLTGLREVPEEVVDADVVPPTTEVVLEERVVVVAGRVGKIVDVSGPDVEEVEEVEKVEEVVEVVEVVG